MQPVQRMDDLHRVFGYTSLSYEKARVFSLKVPLGFRSIRFLERENT